MRTNHYWIESGQLDCDVAAGSDTLLATTGGGEKVGPVQRYIKVRLQEFPKLRAQRLFDEVRAAGCGRGHSRCSPPRLRDAGYAHRDKQTAGGLSVRGASGSCALVVLLSYARLLSFRFYWTQTMALLTAGLECAFEWLGPFPEELLFN